MTRAIRRLSRADLAYLRYETRAAPMQVGALLMIDAAPLVDAAGAVQIDEIRRRIELRLASVPALRRRLLWPAPFHGRPVWIDDPAFSIDRHVTRLALREAAGEAAWLAAVERLMGAPLPRGRPLWGLWVTDRLHGGRVGVLLKLHHVVADGLAAMTMLASLLDVDPHAPDPPPSPYLPEPPPYVMQLLVDRASALVRATRRGVHAMKKGRATWVSMRASGAELSRALRAPAAPSTTINRRVQPGRRVRFISFDQETARSIAHSAGGTINDVVLAVAAGGLRALLGSRGEPTSRSLIASVPVSLRSGGDASGLGNAVGTLAVPLDVSDHDARQRLDAIVRATRQAKQQQHPAQIEAAMSWLAATPLAQPFVARQHFVNVFISNLAGPTVPVYFQGARIHEVIPIVMPVGNVAVAFCAFSYAGTLSLVTTVDANACPDVDCLISGMRATWKGLHEPAPATPATHDVPRPPAAALRSEWTAAHGAAVPTP